MSEFERTFQRVTKIEIDSNGLIVWWIDYEKRENNKVVERNIFAKEFSIVARQGGENAGITIKIWD